jgi:hypothetical protein
MGYRRRFADAVRAAVHQDSGTPPLAHIESVIAIIPAS